MIFVAKTKRELVYLLKLYNSQNLLELQPVYGVISKNTRGILSEYVTAVSEDKNPMNQSCYEVIRKMVELGALKKIGSEIRSGRTRELYTVDHSRLYQLLKEEPLVKLLFEVLESEEWIL